MSYTECGGTAHHLNVSWNHAAQFGQTMCPIILPAHQAPGNAAARHQVAGKDEKRHGQQRVLVDAAKHDLMQRQGRQVQVDEKVLHADGFQGLGPERYHLGIRRHRTGADQLDSNLAELPFGAQLTATHLQDLARVAKA